jgi:hypothetical protein
MICCSINSSHTILLLVVMYNVCTMNLSVASLFCKYFCFLQKNRKPGESHGFPLVLGLINLGKTGESGDGDSSLHIESYKITDITQTDKVKRKST